MSGFFGAALKENCVLGVFFGVDYRSRLGTRRGGMAMHGEKGFAHTTYNIESPPFRMKFEKDIEEFSGNLGIGCTSDNEARPFLVKSHLGSFVIITVGRINNLEELQSLCFERGVTHFLEMSTGEVNPTELVASLVNHKVTIVKGLQYIQSLVKDSMNILLTAQYGIYAAGDLLERTPTVLGEKETGFYTTFKSSTFLSLDYHRYRDLGTREIVLITPEHIEVLQKPREKTKICSLLRVYYGYPTSTCEGVSVECMWGRCGELLTDRDDVEVDSIAGVPDSEIAHAVGYSNVSSMPFARSFIKHTPTWPRSFMPIGQVQRNMVAKMKLIPVQELIRGKYPLLTDDSIVRRTQLGEATKFSYEDGAKKVRVRPTYSPTIFGCKYLNFSCSKLGMDLITHRVTCKLEDDDVSSEVLAEYADPDSERYQKTREEIRQRSSFTSLCYHRLDDMIAPIGPDECKLCTYCRDGRKDDEGQGKEASSAS